MTFFSPVRNPVKKTMGSYPGYVPSLKEGRMIGVESILERDCVILLEVDPRVRAFSEQPCTIEYVIDGKKYKYTPDFAVDRDGQLGFVEVKPQAKATKPKNIRKFEAIRAVFAKNGHSFTVLTEMNIRRQPRLRNAELLLRFGRADLPEEYLDTIVSELRSAGRTSIEALAKRLGGIELIETIYAAISTGRVAADMSQPLGPGSQLCLTS